MYITKLSVYRPILMTMVILTFVVLGVFSFTDLPIDLFPEVDFPVVSIRTVYPGAGPAEIENLITRHIEEEVSAINGIKNITSTSIEGVSIVVIEFEVGTDVDAAAFDVKDKLEIVKPKLPLEAEDPVTLKFDIGAQPIMSLAVSSTRPLDELYELTDTVIKPELMKIPGLATINIIGGKEREIKVAVNQELLKAQDLGIIDVVAGLNVENLNIPGGHITEQRKEYTIRVSGEYTTVDDIRNIDLYTESGRVVRLRDVATVSDDFKEQRKFARFDGLSAVGLSLVRRSGANVVEVSDQVIADIATIKKFIPEDVDITVASDTSNFIRRSIAEVVNNMGIGIFLTALILFIFLHTWEATLIAAVSMPASIISTFILIRFGGFTINFMTLLGLAVTVGVLVTNSIVVLENIFRFTARSDDVKEASIAGTTEIAKAVGASTLTNIVVFTPIAFMSGIVGQFFFQFGLTVAFATVFSLFVSLTLTPMLSAKLLKREKRQGYGFDLFALGLLVLFLSALVVAASLLGGTVLAQSAGSFSMVVSLLAGIGLAGYLGKQIMGQPLSGLKNSVWYRIWRVLVKLCVYGIMGAVIVGGLVYLFGGIAAAWLSVFTALILVLNYRMGVLEKFGRAWDGMYDKLTQDYTASLGKALERKGLVTMSVVVILAVSLSLGKYVGTEFMTHSDEGYFSVAVELPAGSNFEQTNKTLLRIENVLNNSPVIESYYTILGESPATFLGKNEGVQYGEIVVKLIPADQRSVKTRAVMEQLRMQLTKIPMAEITITERSSGGGGEGNALQIEVQGDDLSRLNQIAAQVESIAKSTPGAVDVRSTWREGVPEIQIIPNRKKMADYGVSLLSLATVIRSSIEGSVASKYRVGNKEYDIRVLLNKSYMRFADQVRDIVIKKKDMYIPLTELAQLREVEGPTTISRKNKKRLIIVAGNFVNRSGGDVVADIARQTADIDLPPGYVINFGGQAEIQSESFADLVRALLLAIILAYIVLAAIMESFIQPFIIMMTLPLALIGVIVSLIITGKTISIISLMAIVMLVGIVVNNGILLIDYMETLRKQGKGLVESILEASAARLRPILMTNVATIISMLPLALELGEGAEMRSPMAIVSIGALITSTVFTLYIIPILYHVIEALKERKAAVEG